MLIIIALMLMSEVLFILVIPPSNIKDGIITGIILLVTILFGLSVWLIEDPQKGADIEAAYFDSVMGEVYHFREKDWSVANHFSAFHTVFNEQQYIKEHPLIYILVRKNDYKKGYILMREYFEGKPGASDLANE